MPVMPKAKQFVVCDPNFLPFFFFSEHNKAQDSSVPAPALPGAGSSDLFTAAPPFFPRPWCWALGAGHLRARRRQAWGPRRGWEKRVRLPAGGKSPQGSGQGRWQGAEGPWPLPSAPLSKDRCLDPQSPPAPGPVLSCSPPRSPNCPARPWGTHPEALGSLA